MSVCFWFTQKSFYGHFIICFLLFPFSVYRQSLHCLLHEEKKMRIFNWIERQLKPTSNVPVIDIMIHVYGMKLLAVLRVKMNSMRLINKRKAKMDLNRTQVNHFLYTHVSLCVCVHAMLHSRAVNCAKLLSFFPILSKTYFFLNIDIWWPYKLNFLNLFFQFYEIWIFVQIILFMLFFFNPF